MHNSWCKKIKDFLLNEYLKTSSCGNDSFGSTNAVHNATDVHLAIISSQLQNVKAVTNKKEKKDVDHDNYENIVIGRCMSYANSIPCESFNYYR